MDKGYLLNIMSKVNKESKKYIMERLIEEGIENFDVSHGNIVSVLYANDGKMNMREIGARINRTKSTVSQLVDRMTANGYIVKIPSEIDKRTTDVILTKKGWDLKKSFDDISDEVISKCFDGLNEDEIDYFMKILVKMSKNFSEDN